MRIFPLFVACLLFFGTLSTASARGGFSGGRSSFSSDFHSSYHSNNSQPKINLSKPPTASAGSSKKFGGNTSGSSSFMHNHPILSTGLIAGGSAAAVYGAANMFDGDKKNATNNQEQKPAQSQATSYLSSRFSPGSLAILFGVLLLGGCSLWCFKAIKK